MAKAVLVMDMPESCLKCQMMNSSDECILQDEDANFKADSWEDLRAGCPLVEFPEKNPSNQEAKTGVNYREEVYQVYMNGWNACIDKIMGQ